MRLLRYGDRGDEKPGALDTDGVIRDLSGVIADIAGDTLRETSVNRLKALDLSQLPAVAGNPRLGACVGNVGKFIGIGLNYADHAQESGMKVPPEPMMFLKATSCICGPNDDILLPRASEKTDWEVELGVVIGEPAKHVTEAEALEYVAGYCLVNDVSELIYQHERHGTWDKGKGCDNFGPIGPWMVTKDEIGDPQDLAIWLEVDGKRYQDGSTRTMVYRVPYLVSYLSTFFTLEPGDVITTGTPPGVGMGQKPVPIYLKAGQNVRLGITGLGEQTQKVVLTC